MAKKNINYQAFVNAVRARGRLPHFDLGGGVDLAQGAAPVSGNVQGQTTDKGLTSIFTPQSGYQATLAPTTQLNYTPVVNQAANQALAGYGQQQSNLENEQALANQFLAEGQGQGPNPAQAQLAQNTGNNIAAQAALAASQRGASANAGLVARQAAQQGAAQQQAAAGQAATLQAQQQLAAQQAAASQQGQIGGQILAGQQNANSLFGTGAGATNTQNANLVANYGQAQGTNAATAAANAGANQKTSGGLLGGIASGIGALFGAEGGQVEVGTAAPQPGPQSFAGKFLASLNTPGTDPMATGFSQLGSSLGKAAKTAYGNYQDDSALDALAEEGAFAKGGKVAIKDGNVPAKLSPGEVYLPPEKAESRTPLRDGIKVPGKAKVKGDSLKNDTVNAMLKDGGIVLPRHVTQAPDAPQRAMAFVAAIQAKQRSKRKSA